MKLVRSFSNARKLVAAGVAIGMTALGHAQTTPTAADVVTNVQGITGTSTTAYVAAAGLGVAALTVGVLVYMSKRGWKLR